MEKLAKHVMQNFNDFVFILKKSDGLLLNASDFFALASAYCVNVKLTDLTWVLPLLHKHGYDAIDPIMSYIEQIKPLDLYINGNYNSIYSEIETIDKTDTMYIRSIVKYSDEFFNLWYKCSFGLAIKYQTFNINDVSGHAFVELESMSWVLPFFKLYGIDGLTASLVRLYDDEDPLKYIKLPNKLLSLYHLIEHIDIDYECWDFIDK